MIGHIFKIIWSERKINLWILLELALVFTVLWFCCDYTYFQLKRYFSPKGFDIEHTYYIDVSRTREGNLALENNDPETISDMYREMWTIFERIENHPAIEALSFSQTSGFYLMSYSGTEFIVDSSTIRTQMKFITPGFFDVFGIKMAKGRPVTWENCYTEAVITPGPEGKFGEFPAMELTEILQKNATVPRKVVGVTVPVKTTEFHEYSQVVYMPVPKHSETPLFLRYREISVRVKPDADKDFIRTFREQMQNQLSGTYFYMSGITPFSEYRKEALQDKTHDFYSISAVTAFLLINIFLGVIGTFWFRIQTRKSEIGLRMALGSSKKRVKRLFMTETLLLLLGASLVAALICINFTNTDLLKHIGVPAIDRSTHAGGFSQFLINYGITFIILSAVGLVAVWYPAKKASDIQPTEALRDE